MFTKIKEKLSDFWKALNEEIPEVNDEVNKVKGAVTSIEATLEEVEKTGRKISSANMEKIKAAMDVLRGLMGGDMMDEEEKPGMMGEKPKPKPNQMGVDDKPNLKKGDDIKMEYNDVLKTLTPEQSELVKSELQKQIDSAVKEAITKAQPDNEIKKQLEDLNKQKDELSKALEAEKDIRITKEFIEKAQGFKGLPVKAEDFGKVLKGLSKDAENYAELLKVLEAADNLIIENNALMKELGDNNQVESDAITKMNAKAEEIKKANPEMTKEMALAKAIKENPKLYDEYRASK